VAAAESRAGCGTQIDAGPMMPDGSMIRAASAPNKKARHRRASDIRPRIVQRMVTGAGSGGTTVG
jgi:hypothetical protein